MVLDELDKALIGVIQDGLPLVPRPYAAVAARLGVAEPEIVRRLQALIDGEVIKRFGVVVRHHELGYRANAMIVWDIPDERVAEVGRRLGTFDYVTLCYQRPRRLPAWPYNLFCMIHGRDRETVQTRIDDLIARVGLADVEHAVLFSARRFKQRGARYVHVGAPGIETRPRLAHG